MPTPHEVHYSTYGKRKKKERRVVGVICPTALAQHIGKAKPIYVDMGDIEVDWNEP